MQGLAELSYDCEAVDSGISVPLDDQLPGRKSMGLREDAMREAERAQAHQANQLGAKIQQVMDRLRRGAPVAVDLWAKRIGTTVSDVRISQLKTYPEDTHNFGSATVEWKADGLNFRGIFKAYADMGAANPAPAPPEIRAVIVIDGQEFPANSRLEIGQALKGEAPITI